MDGQHVFSVEQGAICLADVCGFQEVYVYGLVQTTLLVKSRRDPSDFGPLKLGKPAGKTYLEVNAELATSLFLYQPARGRFPLSAAAGTVAKRKPTILI
jgi:hypothetical protein